MFDDYIFSRACLGDADEVYALYRSLIGTPGCSWSDEYPELGDVREDIEKGRLYKLTLDGRIVAAIAAGAGDDIDGEVAWRHELSNVCELSRLGLAREMQGRGLAGHIFGLTLDEMRARGFDGARLMVTHDAHAAQAIYDKAGFVRCGELAIYGCNFICMEKRLL